MGDRLHFLDWLRTILVCFVVYSHLNFCGLEDIPDTTVDNHAYATKPNQYAVRWNSVARQWVIPMLFWISGGAAALSVNGDSWKFLWTLWRIYLISVVGIGANASMWLLGPQDPNCSIRNPCPGKGILFDFTEDPAEGNIEPYFNQMWFTVFLVLMMIVHWPYFKVFLGQSSRWLLTFQWAITVSIYVALTVVAGKEVPNPALLIAWLAVCEFAFLAVSVCAAQGVFPWLPQRIWHYIAAIISLIQVGLSPIADSMDDLTAGYCIYLMVLCFRSYGLGYLMTRPRKDMSDPIDPIVSRAWPLVIVLAVIFAPSTNWYMGGVLTYPYFDHAVDRGLYNAGTLLALFVADRSSRALECCPLPEIIGIASIVLYVFQIVLLTCFMQVGMRQPYQIWAAAAAAALALTGFFAGGRALCCGARRGRDDQLLPSEVEDGPIALQQRTGIESQDSPSAQ